MPNTQPTISTASSEATTISPETLSSSALLTTGPLGENLNSQNDISPFIKELNEGVAQILAERHQIEASKPTQAQEDRKTGRQEDRKTGRQEDRNIEKAQATYYEKLFESKPAASFPTYVAFLFKNGFTFSLWATQAKDFVSAGTGNRSELTFMVQNDDEVRSLYDRWSKMGITIEQDLSEAVFGLTFVALDPDGHRIRVCTLDK